jgi:hypothetical protein
VRLGRLLRQDDESVIQDLIGLACIRLGAQALYDVAVHRGDRDLALAAAIVLGEQAPQRLRTAQQITSISIQPADGVRDTSEVKIQKIVSTARTAMDRRFRQEAIFQLSLVRVFAGRGGVREAEKALDELS